MKSFGDRVARVSAYAVMMVFAGAAVSRVSAQTVTDPRYAVFTASTDHYAINSSGQPVVSDYQLQWYQSGAVAPYTVLDLGKPTPDGTGTITVDLYSYLVGTPLTGVTFTARVAALGPTGTSYSNDSNAFTFSGGCSYVVSPTSISMAAAGATTNAAITTGNACTWSATSLVSWITLNTNQGTGGGSVAVTASANPDATTRTGSLVIANTDVTVAQDPAPCLFSVSPATVSADYAGTTGSVSVTSPSGCNWNASSGTSWITLASSGGSGTQSIGYVVAANSSTSSRIGSLTIAAKPVTITQAGQPAQPPVACTYVLAKTTDSFSDKSSTHTVNLSTDAGCSWNATSDASWLTVTPATGAGSTTVSYTAARNLGAARTATRTIGGQTMTVTQAAKRRR